MSTAHGGATIPEQPTEKCHHAPCACEVERGQWWCSDHCRTMTQRKTPVANEGGMRNQRCQCGHPACQNPELP